MAIKKSNHESDFTDIKLERQLVGALLHNKKAFIKVADTLDVNIFTNPKLVKIISKILSCYLTDNEYVNDDSIIDLLSLTKDKKNIYKNFFNKIKKECVNKKTSFVLVAKKKLEQLYEARLVELSIKNSIDYLIQARNGDLEKIQKAKNSILKVSDIFNVNTKFKIVNPVINFNKWLKEYENKQKHPEKYKGVPTGIIPIDRNIIGVREAEFALVVADTGVGKSIFLLQCGINCWLQYGDVIYITIEMPAEQLENRFWCHLSEINYENFRALRLNDEHKKKIKKIAKMRVKHEYKFHIIDMEEGCTVKSIVSKIDGLMKKRKIKLVVIDYMNIIAGDDGIISLDWETQVGIAINIKQLICRKYNVACWSACQITGENLAFGRHIKDNIDIGILISEDENSDAISTGEILDVEYIKTRDFRATKHVLMANRSLMKMSIE